MQLICDIYKSAFSGEVVFGLQTREGYYQGVAPKHYADFDPDQLSKEPHQGTIDIRLVRSDLIDDEEVAFVRLPDMEIVSVLAEDLL